MAEATPVFVHLLPSLIPSGALRGGVAIVVDVLRATTAMVHALESGCEAVIPCLEVDEARAVAASMPAGRALLGGERLGLPIEGFDLGNSPGSYTSEVCRGKTLVMTTTNGTRAILASLEADRVYIGAFPNAGATLEAAARAGKPVHVVCSGTDGRISLEDTTLAGRIASALLARGGEAGNDEAVIAARLWDGRRARTGEVASLSEWIAAGRGGRRVRQIGLGADLDAAAAEDRVAFAAELRRDPLRIVAVG